MSVSLGVLGRAKESAKANHWFKVIDDVRASKHALLLCTWLHRRLPEGDLFQLAVRMSENSEHAAQTAMQLSPKTMSVLTNFILHNFRFGMLKELRQEGPLWSLTKSLLELGAGWFGYVPRWEHCQNQLKHATSKEQLDAIFHELHYLEIDWRSFMGPISVFSDSPTNDPDWRCAHKIKTLRATMQRQIDNYERGVIRPGHSGESFHSYKDHRVSEMSPVVWKAFVAALDRLEEMRLAKPGAKPWAEDG